MWLFFKTYWILWQNSRNLEYIKEYNWELARRLADSKLKTKDFLQKKWVKVALNIAILFKHEELNNDLFLKLDPPFVIKPNNGYWWKWIIIIDKKDSLWNYVSSHQKIYSKKSLIYHFSNIIDWFYSISWLRDKVIIEKKIILNHEIDLLWKFGLPDIRVIVFNMVPVMAMLRVPTKESDWKANLHAWACWVWIDIWTWKLTYMTRYSKIIKSIPNIWDVRGIKIPYWNEILTLAVKVQQVTWIWYLWCDIVLDDKEWPLLLEMNIRSWLEVQVANMAALKSRLEKVEGININWVEKWVRLWRDLFGWDIEEKIKNISWKKILWTREYLTINHDSKKLKYLADIKLWDSDNYIDNSFAKNILKMKEEDFSEQKILRLTCSILWEEKSLKFILKDLSWKNIILWSSSLKWFLVDPFKYRKWELPISEDLDYLKSKNKAVNKTYDEQIFKIDKELVSIDKKLILLKYISPTNLEEEKKRFIDSNWKYVPNLKYKDFNLNLDSLKTKLDSIEIPEIPLSSIYKDKKKEILNKIKFLQAFKNQDSSDFTNYSLKIFWKLDVENLELSNNKLSHIWDIKSEDEYLSFEEIKWYINKFNHIYSIKINLKPSDKSARFVMKWENLLYREWSLVWKKEMRSIIAHEIEGHYLRKLNWRKLKYSIFWHGTAWYLEIDEWIAIYNQNRFLNENSKKYYSIFERYYFVNFALKNSYKKLVSKMIEFYNWDLELVFNYLVRIKRWLVDISDDWVFTRDLVYLNWFMKLEKFLASSWVLRDLYVWKINIEDLSVLKDSYFIKLDFSDLKVPFFL